jgi:hypothetical protein
MERLYASPSSSGRFVKWSWREKAIVDDDSTDKS